MFCMYRFLSIINELSIFHTMDNLSGYNQLSKLSELSKFYPLVIILKKILEE